MLFVLVFTGVKYELIYNMKDDKTFHFFVKMFLLVLSLHCPFYVILDREVVKKRYFYGQADCKGFTAFFTSLLIVPCAFVKKGNSVQ